jgi:hypothetical protein
MTTNRGALMTSATVETAYRRRPLLVWIILLFQGSAWFVWFLVASLAVGLKLGNMLSVSDRALFENLSILSLLTATVTMTVWTIAAVALFRLRAIAVEWFAISLVLSLLGGWRAKVGWFEMFPTLVGGLAILLYAIRLRRRGALL